MLEKVASVICGSMQPDEQGIELQYLVSPERRGCDFKYVKLKRTLSIVI